MAKVNEVAARYPSAELVCEYTAAEWLTNSIANSLSQLINWENGTCNFESAEFVNILDALRRFPAEPPTDRGSASYKNPEYYSDYMTKFKEDRCLLVYTPISNPRAIRDAQEAFDEEITVLGFPSPDGGANVLRAVFDYGILSSSQYKNEAWEFISMHMQDGSSTQIKGIGTINKHDFEAELAAEKIPFMERDFSKLVLVFKYTGLTMEVDGFMMKPDAATAAQYENYHLSEPDAEMVSSAMESAMMPHSGEEFIVKIVLEEAEAFLNGVRSAEETARIIQRRVSIYVSENI